jgi:2-desacetyl-2-hydroxyethyl bacteriochlorophyllide A dehydrogenase
MKASAVVFEAPNKITFRSVDCPDPGDQDVVVRVTHSWISNGTEGSYLKGERVDGDTPYKPGDTWPYPVVAGYQKIGVVESVGSGVSEFTPGQVVFATIGRVSGMHHWYAGHVSPSVCPVDHVWALPDGVDPLAFSGLVLTQVGYNAGIRAPMEAGEAAVVVGDGLVGQWTAQTLLWRGAHVVVVGRHSDRLTHLKSSCMTLNEREDDWVSVVRDRFPNGVTVGVDTVGSITVMEQLTSVSRRYGHLVSAGFYGTKDQLALQPPRYKELSIHLVSGWTRQRMDETLRLVGEGVLNTLHLITHHFPVEQASDAWELIFSKQEPVLGVILDWPEV